MVDLVVLQSVSYVAAAIGVCIAAVYYVMTLRVQQINMKHTLETRQAQFMMQLNESMTNVEVYENWIELMNMEWTDLDDFEKKWGTGGNPEAAAKRLSLWWRYGFLGQLLQRDLVDREWLHSAFSTLVLQQWFKWEPIIMRIRKIFNNPQWNADFEYIAKEMIKMDEQKGIKRRIPKTLTHDDTHVGKIEPS
jgi:hypothetical protein